MRKAIIGILAHVDAGKTTMSEAMLYKSGKLKKPGRVDHKDAYLDTHELERARGITIFSKQALFDIGDLSITLLDTPGHIDFSTEMERTLQVLDYAILVISASDGVQAHTETLWSLLRRYRIPVFVWINKMDLTEASPAQQIAALKKQLGGAFVDFRDDQPAGQREENIAVCDDGLLARYLDSGMIPDADTSALIRERRLFPCLFGSALKLTGVTEFLSCLQRYIIEDSHPDAFGARVYKISRDSQGNRLTWLKITGGSLKVRTALTYCAQDDPETVLEEKISQIRLYSGAKFETADEMQAGSVCAVSGLTKTWCGQGLGAERAPEAPVLEPVLTYRILLPAGCDSRAMLPKLQQLAEEDPLLRIVWDEQLREIHAQLMGEVQIEVLKDLIADRFGVPVRIDSGRIRYKETIAAPVEGVGHFEPLRHYAEVHLLLEPLPRGAGLIFETACSEDLLARNWQNLVLTHLAEKPHLGVLTGSPLTDLKITLVAGRAHLKHTGFGDFRQATYRAVRQGLMQAENVLLEPYYAFRLEVPSEQIGRAISDVRAMSGSFSAPQECGDMLVLRGNAPVSEMRSYFREVLAYTRGRGKISCHVSGYGPCHNTEELLAVCDYDPQRDLLNTPDSVFCSHGAGLTVKWDHVSDFMHVDSGLRFSGAAMPVKAAPRVRTRNLDLDEKELEAIMEREFGPIKRPKYLPGVQQIHQEPAAPVLPPKKEYLIVDGYNMIFAWDELKSLARDNPDNARHRLLDILSNYQGYKGCELVLVFDGYKRRDNPGQKYDRDNIHVVYTKENETADAYIEKLTAEIGRNYSVRIATSDALIQLSALRSGALRMSARELKYEIDVTRREMDEVMRQSQGQRTSIGDLFR